MSNIITPSFFNRSLTWLRQETFPSKAKNNNTNTPLRWVAKQTKATNISLASGIVWLGTYLAGFFAQNSNNKFLNFLIKGTRWLSGILGVVTPLANISTKRASLFEAQSPLFDANDTNLKEKIVKVIIEDLETPFHSLHKPCVFPSYSKEKEYREKIYSMIYELSKDPKDPLWLNASEEEIPISLKERIQELKRSLLSSYREEHCIHYIEDYKSNYSKEVDNLLENIFVSCRGLSYAEAVKYDVRSGEIPIELAFCDQEGVNLWESENKSYKENKYRAFEELSRDDKKDYFYLNELPTGLKGDCKVHEFLLKAYEEEKTLIKLSDSRGSEMALASLETILSRGVTIERNLWDEEYVFKEFEAWGSKVAEGNLDLRKTFNAFTKTERGTLDKCKKILEASEDVGYGDINNDILEILEMINSSLENLDSSIEKGSFSVSCLSVLLSKEVLHGGLVSIDRLIGYENKERIINNLRSIVSNLAISPDTKRNLNFFLNPGKESIVGQSVCLLHKLLPPQPPRYDEFNECNKLLEVARRSLYESKQKTDSRIALIAGSPEVSRDFIRYVSEILCVPIVEIEDFYLILKDEKAYVNHKSNEIPISEFFEGLANRSPIMISFKYFDSIVKNKSIKNQEINIIRSALCEELNKINKLSKPIIVTVEIEGKLDYEKLKDTSFDSNGYSDSVNDLLQEYLHPDFTSSEINPICFHGLQKKKIAEYKVEELIKRKSILDHIVQYLILANGKKTEGDLDFEELALASIGLSNKQVGKAVEEYTPENLTQQNILEAFEQIRKAS